jgi:transposase
MSREVGRPSVLNDELKREIRDLVLEGKNGREVSEIIGVPYDTFRGWLHKDIDAASGFAEQMTTWRHERMLAKAEANIEQLQEAENDKVRLQANTFVAETLGKKRFAKRSEVTGEGGSPITLQVVSYRESNDPV